MNLIDVNVLVYARRADADRHAEYRTWLSRALNGPEPVAIASHSLASVVRILTHRRIWPDALTTTESLAYAALIRSSPVVVLLEPGPAHWAHFEMLCRDAGARANLVMDAWIAALAIENSCTLITTDRDFARFRGLRHRHPLAA